jgi:predicted NACHT family NTPase
MLDFIDNLISEPIKDIYQGLKNEAQLWKNLKFGVKDYINSLADELNIINLHRANNPRKLSDLFIEPKLLDVILSEKYGFDFNSNFEIKEYLINRNPRSILRKTYIKTESYKTIYDLIKVYNKQIILGQPGSGKTSVVRKLVIDISQGKGLPLIPIYIPLRNSALKTETLYNYINFQFEKYGIQEASLFTEKILKEGRALLLFDGIDEIGVSTRQKLIDEINDLSKKYSDNKIIATSRISSYAGELNDFKEIEVCEFNRKDTLDFIDNWFGAEEKKNLLIDRLEHHPQIFEIANHPLLLSLICIVFENDLELSSRKSTLYKRCIECLIRDWDAQRNFRRDTQFAKLDEPKRITILNNIAFYLHNNGKIYFEFNTIAPFISTFINKFGLEESDIPMVFDEIINHFGLIIEVSKDVYAFSHLTLQEFFAANYIADHRLYLTEKFDFIPNPFWEEVLILCSSILPDASEYLNSILENIDCEPNNIFIAGLCLSVDPVVDVSLKEKIARLVLERYHNYKIKDEHERAFYVISRIDDTFVGAQLLNNFSKA